MEEQPIIYKSLADINLRKEALRNDIIKDEQKIQTMWKGLFERPAALRSGSTGNRIMALVGNGAGLVDGLILGWKLYRKFRR